MSTSSDRPDDAKYGLIYLIANGDGKGMPAFDGNVFSDVAEAEKFLVDFAEDNDEYMRLTSDLLLHFATKEEMNDWRRSTLLQHHKSTGETS